MRRTTIMADDELLARLRKVARAEGKSLATVIREGMELRVRETRPRPTFIGAFASGYTDTSERVDEIIREHLSRKFG